MGFARRPKVSSWLSLRMITPSPIGPHLLLAFGAFSRHTNGRLASPASPPGSPVQSRRAGFSNPGSRMSMLKTIVPKADRTLVPKRRKIGKEDYRQRELMVGSLCLLLLALGIVLWHDRDFWFPDTPDAESDQPIESPPAAKIAPAKPATTAAKLVAAAKSKHRSKLQPKHPLTAAAISPAPSIPPPAEV